MFHRLKRPRMNVCTAFLRRCLTAATCGGGWRCPMLRMLLTVALYPENVCHWPLKHRLYDTLAVLRRTDRPWRALNQWVIGWPRRGEEERESELTAKKKLARTPRNYTRTVWRGLSAACTSGALHDTLCRRCGVRLALWGSCVTVCGGAGRRSAMLCPLGVNRRVPRCSAGSLRVALCPKYVVLLCDQPFVVLALLQGMALCRTTVRYAPRSAL